MALRNAIGEHIQNILHSNPIMPDTRAPAALLRIDCDSL